MFLLFCEYSSLGSVCTKSITFTVNDTTILLRKNLQTTILPSLAFTQSTPVTEIEIIKSTFYDIIHTKLGITLMWDRHTRILISLQPQFKGIRLLSRAEVDLRYVEHLCRRAKITLS